MPGMLWPSWVCEAGMSLLWSGSHNAFSPQASPAQSAPHTSPDQALQTRQPRAASLPQPREGLSSRWHFTLSPTLSPILWPESHLGGAAGPEEARGEGRGADAGVCNGSKGCLESSGNTPEPSRVFCKTGSPCLADCERWAPSRGEPEVFMLY